MRCFHDDWYFNTFSFTVLCKNTSLSLIIRSPKLKYIYSPSLKCIYRIQVKREKIMNFSV